jgi:hypothetical protein
MYQFCEDVIAVFGKYYLREPNVKDTANLLSINESRGFPGMLESILHAFAVEDMSFWLARAVQTASEGLHSHTKCCCITGSMDLALLWHSKIKQ